jgi:polyketide synthase PksL
MNKSKGANRHPDRSKPTEPIAIVGMALRFPGAQNLEEFWEILSEGRSVISALPNVRRQAGFPVGQEFWGGFIEDADCFDAEFFGVSPREAQTMDPQQRFVMELAWNALEDAGFAPASLTGSRTGVFMGVCHWDYLEMIGRSSEAGHAYTPTGIAPSIVSNRISYHFDFKGPSVTNDTACASALVAIFQASQSLQGGDCEMALAGAANLIWSPDHFLAFTKNGMLSRTGRSRAFDAAADGYVRGEGAAVLVLKTLARAEQDGDAIHAVIRGIGINHGGRTSSLTVTNPTAQAELIYAVHRDARVAPNTLDFVEAHGTGTLVGDPIETLGLKKALTRLYEEAGIKPEPGRTAIGSVKTNIGHLEGAAGLAGVAKVIAALRYEQLPPNAGFERPNPLLRLENSPLRLIDALTPWNERGRGKPPRRAAISSFGFGGANAHAVLEAHADRRKPQSLKGRVLVPLSARDMRGLRDRAASILRTLRSSPDISLTSLAWTLQTGREAMPIRLALVAGSTMEVVAILECFLAGQNHATLWLGDRPIISNENVPEKLDGRPLEHVAQAFVQGQEIDWGVVQKPSPRIHLPGYSFAHKRHWHKSGSTPLSTAALTLTNRSSFDAIVFDLAVPLTHPILADHRINGVQVLPGAAILEAVRAAAVEALVLSKGATLQLTDTIWLRPIQAGKDGVSVSIRFEMSDSGRAAFHVTGSEGTVLCKGHVAEGRPPVDAPDNAAHESESRPFAPDLCYERLTSFGIEHGPAFRALSALKVMGQMGVAADITLPDAAGAVSDFGCHPVLIDASIQAIAALPLSEPDGPPQPLGIPFALDRIIFVGPCTDRMRALVTRHGDGYNIDVLREDGVLAFRLVGLATKATTTATASAHQIALASPRWIMAKALPASGQELSVVALGVATLSDPRLPALERGGHRIVPLVLPTDPGDRMGHRAAAMAALDLSRRLLQEQSGKPGVRLLFVLPEGMPLARALSPLLKTVALEDPRLQPRILEVEPMEVDMLSGLIVRESNLEGASDIRVTADGLREERRFAALTPVEALPWVRTDAVCWITGGTGGLGRKIAAHLVRCGYSHVILSGRNQRTQKLPDGVDYVPCDVADMRSVQAGLAAIATRHGPVTGIIHCAGVLRDGLAFNKAQDELAAVFLPKVDGLITLDQATAECPLDFLIVCSSIAALHGATGQVDYAAANGFMDGYLDWRRGETAAGRRRGRSIVINWPLWAQGGMQVDARAQRAMTVRMGVVPMPDAEGLALFDQALWGQQSDHIAAGYGVPERIAEFLASGDVARSPEPSPSSAPNASLPSPPRTEALNVVKRIFADVLAIGSDHIRPDLPFVDYGFDSIIAVETIERLEVWLSVPLSKTLLFEKINLNDVVDHLFEEHEDALRAVLAPVKAAPASLGSAETMVADSAKLAPASARLTAPFVQTRPQGREIAVIGIGGHYPGADDLDGFWANLKNGVHSFRSVPAERWPHEEIYFPERSVLGKSTIQTGSFLDDMDKFDPRYFNISQADATNMSPEVRLLLQTAVETFEDAGYSRECLQQRFDADVAVIVGTMSNHYNLYGFQNMLARGVRSSGSYTGTMPNMISYFYGLTGPSLFVDTMCSASLTSLDLAVRLLREGQCRMALAGGVNLLLHPYNMISSSQEHFTSNRAEVIRSFGHGADGTILGEGVGTALLKPLKDAERDGDNIHAVILGTAMANAGQRNGFTVPNPTMQAKAVRDALQDAGVDASTISYIETHGSGTKLGDPIEIAALHEVFGKDGRCAIGSVKSNIAHLLAAAGIVGFTKLLLQMRHKLIVPSLHSEALNPAIPFDRSPFVVQQSLTPWAQPLGPDGDPLPRRAGLTSIGAGGMNAHMIVEEYIPPTQALSSHTGPFVMVFSATTPKALAMLLDRFSAWIAGNGEADPAAVAYTLQIGRTALRCRFACVVPDLLELVRTLEAFRADQEGAWFYTEDILAVAAPEADLPSLPSHSDPLEFARLWAGGQAVDWAHLSPGATPPRRISLPTYPFEKVRCWYDIDDDAPSVLRPEAFRRRLHPLIGRNVSDLTRVGFATRLRLDDLLDYVSHRNSSERLDACALMDAAIAAFMLASCNPQELHNLVWYVDDLARCDTLDFVIGEGAQKTLELTVTSGDVLLFAAQMTHGEGAAEDLSIPLTACSAAPLSQEAIASIYAEARMEAGSYAHHLAEFAYDSDGLCIASICPPDFVQDHSKSAITLPPEVLNGITEVIQLSAKVSGYEGWENLALRRVERLVLAESLQPVTQVRARLSRKGTTMVGRIDLLDGQGRLAVVLSGFEAAGEIGHLDVQPSEDTTPVLRTFVADLLKFDPAEIDTRTGFYALGFDSISLAALAERINVRFGSKLTPDVFYDLGTIGALAVRLEAEAQKTAPQPISRPRVGLSPSPAVAAVPPATAPALAHSPIAVIGMAGRFPGAVDVEAFAMMLKEGRQALCPLPLERYSPAYAARIVEAGLPQEGGFLDDIARFDADFFQISRAEAEVTDPQHRLVLETVWQALENAGQQVARLPRQTGVFLGVSGQDYREMMLAEGVPPSGYMSTGTSHAMLANRVSHMLDLQGPSEAIDTACSSSLVAVHRAVSALRAGQCMAAFAGGVNIALALEPFAGPQAAGMLSPGGRCRTFSEAADGYVRGEGVGVVLLKTLADAQRDGDPILAIIIGASENHGGRANSLTAPRTSAQADLIVSAMAGVDPSTIGLLEAHGTGTPLGDPVEVNGLQQAYQRLAEEQGVRLTDGQCALGSVKTNIGHLEAAAGIAGLIKIVLSLRDEMIYPTLDALPPNPYLKLQHSPFRVVTKARSWSGPCQRAAISSFGFGGANAHVVLETPPPSSPPVAAEGPQLIVLSARTPKALAERIVSLSDYLTRCREAGAENGPCFLMRIAYTLQAGREAMEERLAFVVGSLDELRERLTAMVRGYDADVCRDRVRLRDGFPPLSNENVRLEASAAFTTENLEACARHWVSGGEVIWEQMHPSPQPQRIALPGYPFAGHRYWMPISTPSEPIRRDVMHLLDEFIEGRTEASGILRVLAE